MIDCRMHHTGSPRWHCRMKAAPFAMILSLSGCGPGDREPTPAFVQRDSSGVILSITSGAQADAALGWEVDPVPSFVVGTGDAPSEYLSRVQGVKGLSNGRLLVVDGESAQLRFFDSRGRLLHHAGGKGEGPGEFRDPVLVPSVGNDSLGYNSGTWSSSIPFSSRPAAAVAGSGALITDGRTFEIRDYDVGGQLRRIIRVHKSRRPVTKELIEAYLDKLAETPNANRDGMTRQFSEMPIQDTLPAFQSLQIDETGWLWAQVYQWDTSAPKEWIVFDPKGRANGTVLTPAGLEVQSIGRDFIVGVWRDQFDVEYVQRHALRRSVSAVEQPTEG